MLNAQEEEMKHFAMDLEWLIRRKPKWKVTLENVLFKQGDIVQHGNAAQKKADQTKERLA